MPQFTSNSPSSDAAGGGGCCPPAPPRTIRVLGRGGQRARRSPAAWSLRSGDDENKQGMDSNSMKHLLKKSAKKTLSVLGRNLHSMLMAGDPGESGLYYDSRKNVAVGLKNLGNTCYLNSSLQMLLSVPGFASDLRATHETILSGSKSATIGKCEGEEGPGPAMPLTEALLKVASYLNVLGEPDTSDVDSFTDSESTKSDPCGDGDGGGDPAVASLASLDDDPYKPSEPRPDAQNVDSSFHNSAVMGMMGVTPNEVKKAMDTLKFTGYEQHDAHEFLSGLIDRLHDELVAAANKSSACMEVKENGASANDDEKDPTGSGLILPTDKYFRLDVTVRLTCDACGQARPTRRELYRHLSLHVGDEDDDTGAGSDDRWSLERGLEHFFEPEKRETQCEHCAEGKVATQRIEIVRRPKVLLLHLNRFIVKQNDKGLFSVHKNKARVVLRDSISIDRFCVKEEKTDDHDDGPAAHQDAPLADWNLYDALSVVHHAGNAFRGHYTTDSLRTRSTGLVNGGGSEEDVGDEPRWVAFDDDRTRLTTPGLVLNSERSQRNVYMAMYHA